MHVSVARTESFSTVCKLAIAHSSVFASVDGMDFFWQLVRCAISSTVVPFPDSKLWVLCNKCIRCTHIRCMHELERHAPSWSSLTTVLLLL
jgi:hypothetical protein